VTDAAPEILDSQVPVLQSSSGGPVCGQISGAPGKGTGLSVASLGAPPAAPAPAGAFALTSAEPCYCGKTARSPSGKHVACIARRARAEERERAKTAETVAAETALQLGWRTWRAAYRVTYGGTYAHDVADAGAMTALVKAARATVAAAERPPEDLETYLVHMWRGYLADAGSTTFSLAARRHALRHCRPAGYGTPWDTPTAAMVGTRPALGSYQQPIDRTAPIRRGKVTKGPNGEDIITW
jgi:hypothetical protein